jgi:hypothetical protein
VPDAVQRGKIMLKMHRANHQLPIHLHGVVLNSAWDIFAFIPAIAN